ncbi:MAG: hypothetical protein GY768_13485 [Planctomycetaceae bacterium]|nr:hypothetical protein [Planctomycetaceae bacterium]
MNLPAVYSTYILFSVFITVSVAHTLHNRGRLFLIECFHGNKELAGSVNALLVLGFYLINLAFVMLTLKYGRHPSGLRETLEYLTTKIGIVLLLLSCMHYLNLFVFTWIARHRQKLTLKNENGLHSDASVFPH